MIIVLRAGGVGSRLWPLSREQKPKQFHALIGERTMLQESFDRVKPIVNLEHIYVSTHQSLIALVREQLPEVLPNRIIVEPERKDTAAAIALESVIIHHSYPDAIVASLGSDHNVKDVAEFQTVLSSAEQFVKAHPEYIVPIGIEPTSPDTGYGYIQCAEVLQTINHRNVFRVARFTEKPALEDAKHFLSEGSYLWNANMFVWNVSTILELYKTHMPEMYAQIQEIAGALGTEQQDEVIARVYPAMQKVAVDYAIIEKASHIAAIPAAIGWSDIGDWARLKDEAASFEQENVAIGAQVLSIDTQNTLVYGSSKNKTIVTVGLDHLLIVDTEDALLICNKYSSQDVKRVVDMLKERNEKGII